MTITVSEAVQKGFSRTINARIAVAVLYAANLLLVFPLVYAVRSVLQAAAGASLETGVLNTQFDFLVLTDLLRANAGALGALTTAAAGVMFLYLPLTIFLSGGIFAAVRQEGQTVTVGDLLSAGAAYFGRFLRLGAILLAGWAVIAIPLLSVFFLVTGIWQEGAQTEIPETISLGLRLLFVALLVIPLLMAYDYARADAVITGGTSMRRSAWRGARFLYRRLGRTIKLQLLLILLFLVLIVVYLLLAGLVGTASPVALTATVLLQQLFVLKRMGLRIFGAATASVLYRELSPEGGGIPGWDTGHPWA
jgi:hypothetical protein